jgi:hypothetical protein
MRRKVMPHARLATLTFRKHGQGKYRNPNCHEENTPIEPASRRLLRCIQADFHRLAGNLNLKISLIDPLLPATSRHTNPHPMDSAPESAILEDLRQRTRYNVCFLCLESRVFGMYGPPLCRKRKVRIAGVVCAYVYGLVGVFNDPGPGWNALRSVPG